MATIKDIRRRIRSIQSTQQITKAMEMVSAAKLRRAQDRIQLLRPYTGKMTDVLQSLATAASGRSDPLFDRREIKRQLCMVVASDKGLCGAFNANVFRQIEGDFPRDRRDTVDLVPVGKRASDYFGKRRWNIPHKVPELGDQLDLAKAQFLARFVTDRFKSGDVDQVDLIYTKFITTGTRRIVREILLPIAPPAAAEGRALKDYIFEPSADAIFGDLLPRYIQTRVMAALADSLASEHAARLVSMTAATKNAGEVIDALILVRNKLRQAAITKEISELVGGAEALR